VQRAWLWLFFAFRQLAFCSHFNYSIDNQFSKKLSSIKIELSRIGRMVENTGIRFVRLNENAKSPIFGSLGAAGADLCSAENCMIPAKGKLT
jgi:hypothetical protein